MEVLETARVDAFCMNDVVVSAERRRQVLCVVWEGTCVERKKIGVKQDKSSKNEQKAVWYAGDWTGPLSMQPERRLSGESATSKTHDVIAMSSEGVKVRGRYFLQVCEPDVRTERLTLVILSVYS